MPQPCRRGGRRPDAPDALDRQRVQERELALGRHDEQPIRFRNGARDLGEELRPGDPDGDGDADLLAHPAAEPYGDLARRAREALHAAHVEEGLVDRDPLDERGRVLEDREERLARSRVLGHARRHDERLGTEAARLPAPHRRADAVRLRLVARGQYDTAADDHRLPAQPRVVPLLDRREERVRVGVKDRRRHEQMFAKNRPPGNRAYSQVELRVRPARPAEPCDDDPS